MENGGRGGRIVIFLLQECVHKIDFCLFLLIQKIEFDCRDAERSWRKGGVLIQKFEIECRDAERSWKKGGVLIQNLKLNAGTQRGVEKMGGGVDLKN